MLHSPLVSIVIPTHNRKESLFRLIKSILASTYKNIEVVIIDDASSDNTFEGIKRRYGKNKKIKIYRNKKNLFTAGSRNRGLKKCIGDLVFFVDDDNVLDRNAIKELVGAFKDGEVGEAGPVNYSFSNPSKVLWFKTRRNMFTTKTYQPRNISLERGKKIWDSADVPNAFMVRGDMVRKYKILFREKFGIMYEESDYAYRIRALGYKVVVVRGAKIFHDIETSEKKKKNKDYMYHFMTDARRPYVTARNRILFHFLYSSKLSLVCIMLFWIWLFSGFYAYKILFYNGVGQFSIWRRVTLVWAYFRGDIDGIGLVLSGAKLS